MIPSASAKKASSLDRLALFWFKMQRIIIGGSISPAVWLKEMLSRVERSSYVEKNPSAVIPWLNIFLAFRALTESYLITRPQTPFRTSAARDRSICPDVSLIFWGTEGVLEIFHFSKIILRLCEGQVTCVNPSSEDPSSCSHGSFDEPFAKDLFELGL